MMIVYGKLGRVSVLFRFQAVLTLHGDIFISQAFLCNFAHDFAHVTGFV